MKDDAPPLWREHTAELIKFATAAYGEKLMVEAARQCRLRHPRMGHPIISEQDCREAVRICGPARPEDLPL